MITRLARFFLLTFIFFVSSCEVKTATENTAQQQETHNLIYTKHARCRMVCRTITENEVQAIIAENHINANKSKTNDTRCPTYAYEGYAHDGQHLRIVIAKCSDVWKVVTCIDLEQDFTCNCK